jgi:hypothetical protein
MCLSTDAPPRYRKSLVVAIFAIEYYYPLRELFEQKSKNKMCDESLISTWFR